MPFPRATREPGFRSDQRSTTDYQLSRSRGHRSLPHDPAAAEHFIAAITYRRLARRHGARGSVQPHAGFAVAFGVNGGRGSGVAVANLDVHFEGSRRIARVPGAVA